jgi:hypothetical protein
MDFLKSLWDTLVGVEEEPPKAIVHKRKASPTPTVTIKRTKMTRKRAVSPMPALTLEEPAVSLQNTTSYSMLNKGNEHSGKSPRMTGLAQLEKNRKRRYTLKQGHKAKTATNN